MAHRNQIQKHSKSKYEESLRMAINSALRRDFGDPQLSFISITKVELSEGYESAQVWWDTLDSDKRGDVKKSLESLKGKLRSLLATRLPFRYMPELKFTYDSQYEDQKRIEDLLKKTRSPQDVSDNEDED